MTWIWEHKNWTDFTWKEEKVNPICREIAFHLGALSSRTGVVEKNQSAKAELDSLLKNIITSSAIEGENLNVFSVRSSIAKRLKLKVDKFPTTDKTEGLAELQFDILRNTEKKVTINRMYQWHRWLFPEGESKNIAVGKFRGKTPMQVVSGRMDSPKVHFEAPPRDRLVKEMKTLIDWFFASGKDLSYDPFIRAGISHLWFVTIHPFDDGNGRLARILSELALAQFENKTIRLYSLSSTILDKRKEYYSILEKTQKGKQDITEWLVWFLEALKLSIQESINRIEKVFYKTIFWREFSGLDLSPEQKKVLNTMLDSETDQFQSGISARQYQKLTRLSKATATRHLTELAALGCLKKLSSGGRSTGYVLTEL